MPNANAKCQMPNAKCQMPNAKCQMPNANAMLMPNAKCQMLMPNPNANANAKSKCKCKCHAKCCFVSKCQMPNAQIAETTKAFHHSEEVESVWCKARVPTNEDSGREAVGIPARQDREEERNFLKRKLWGRRGGRRCATGERAQINANRNVKCQMPNANAHAKCQCQCQC